MLHLMSGTDRLANSGEVLAQICRSAGQGDGDLILIVPEQFSHEAERALCRAGGDTISRSAEVLSFTRLASRVFSLYGGVCEEYLDEGGRLLTMYLSVQQVLPQIKYYASACTKPEFLKRLCGAMEEFLSCCLSPESLREAAEQVSGAFAQKLTELSLIYESYLSVCKTGRNDPVTRLLRLGELLEREPYARGRRFYLDGFSDFTAAELRVLAALIRGADEVTVALTTDGSQSPFFRTASETLRQLKTMAARLQAGCEEKTVAPLDVRPRDTDFWAKNIFSGSASPYLDAAPDIRLHAAGSLEEECRSAAMYIRRLTENGLRCREICVAAADPSAYLPVLRPALARAGIPAYYAGSTDILKKPLFSAILSAMQAVERYDADDVLRYLKSAYSPLTPDAADRVEQYACFWNLRGTAWEKDWALHPRGYGEEWDDETKAQLAQLNIWREAAIAPLARLRRAWRGAANVEGLVAALFDFLEQIGLRETLQAETDERYRKNDLQGARQTEQLSEILLGAMDQTVRVLGKLPMQPEQFTQLFRMLLGCYQVGTIPAAVDEVQVGGLPSFRYGSTKALVVLGADDGRLPSFRLPLGILTDEERKKLLSLGVTLSPAQEEQVDRELSWILAVFSGATGSAALSCCTPQPSYLWQKTQLLFPGVKPTGTEDFPYLPDAGRAASEILSRGAQALPDSALTSPVLLQCLHELDKKRNYQFTPLSRASVQGLYGRELKLSASRIDKFAACKYACFLDYGLKAEPWKKAKFDAPIFGTFVHYVLECTAREVGEAGGFAAVSEQALLKIAQKHVDAYTKTYMPDLGARGERFAYLYRRNLSEVLSVVRDVGRELRASKFQPRDEELSFTEGGALPPVRVETPEGASVISGFVDRVDLYEDGKNTYFRVVDYKTGHKDFDYADLLNGEGLQMLIYLFALKKYGGARYGAPLRPAGVLYVPAREDMERVAYEDQQDAEAIHGERRRRKGLLLNDEQLLGAMEENLNRPQYLPLQMKKSGLSGDLASREQLDQLERFVEKTLREMTSRMFRGDVQPDPIIRGPQKSSCTYCDFAEACHKDSCEHHNRYIAAVRSEKFWEELERRERHG